MSGIIETTRVLVDRIVEIIKVKLVDPSSGSAARVTGGAVHVTGDFATQVPSSGENAINVVVSYTAGGATADKQDAQTAILTDIETNTGLGATEATLADVKTAVESIDTKITACDTTGKATETKQDDAIVILNNIETNTGLGATEATLAALDAKVTACNTGAIAGTVTANAGTNLNTSALALEAGGNLAAVSTSLSSIDGKITACNTGAIAGTVTANAGTNLNTSALALETGGNLAATAGSAASIDGKITACNTGAVVVSSGTITGITNPVAVTGTFWQATQPVIGTVAVSNHPTEFPLPAAQVATLTPPAAITGFATETTLSAINGKLAAEFEVNEIENASATITYVGAETAAGVWWIRKMDSTSGSAIGHATEVNNATYTTYTDAWTNRATLTYGLYSEAF